MTAAEVHLSRWRAHSDREQLAPLSEPVPTQVTRNQADIEAQKQRLRDATPVRAYLPTHAQEL
ncbi:hypothetical protein [Marilutibacter alkalisoli]|uniref:Uncharacterized protein n=1 Tax=Marilutibacter alkalisoli TaxID=2591633 RepID=A0A514BU25_9GAMM|nr:hypothetical protein [Lysobacter alkalisoli]QDH70872.1 hypothetical protein FKV23_12840 [Lysobacter alkalisoli]